MVKLRRWFSQSGLLFTLIVHFPITSSYQALAAELGVRTPAHLRISASREVTVRRNAALLAPLCSETVYAALLGCLPVSTTLVDPTLLAASRAMRQVRAPYPILVERQPRAWSHSD